MKLGIKALVILVPVIIVSALHLYSLRPIDETQVYQTGFDEYMNNTYYRKLGTTRYLVDTWTLKYYHTAWIEPRPCHDYGPFSVIFEVPEGDTVIEISGQQVIPDDGEVMFPLVLYQGDAYSVDSTPIWNENVSCMNPVQILVEESGWYTMSLTGSVSKNGHRFSLRGWGNSTHETVLLYVSFTLKKDGSNSMFKVDNRIWE